MKHKRAFPKSKFNWMFLLLAVYLLVLTVILKERSGIRYTSQFSSLWLDPASVTLTENTAPAECLLLWDSDAAGSIQQHEQWVQILSDMGIDYSETDLVKRQPPAFSKYKTVVITLSDLTGLGERLIELLDYQEDGGQLLFAAALDQSPVQQLLQRLGIAETGFSYVEVGTMAVDGFMIGGNHTFSFEDVYPSSLSVRLTDDCAVHITTGGKYPNPVLWQRDFGKGHIVVVNLGFNEKNIRGIYAAAYSLLSDVCVYKVVNSSTFYIDDFPSPVPAGNAEYVRRDFGYNIAGFYANVWWPDMLKLADKYGLRYTGVIIENYQDDVDAPYERNTDIDRFRFFGASLLEAGGELGYHGYNHQPLVLESFDYHGEEDYTKWPSVEAMTGAVAELGGFCESLFPDTTLHVYVPPSNILSAEGRRVLADTLPALQGVASLYFSSAIGYQQELTVAEDGVVEMPRIVSGLELTDYMKVAVFSELNLHFYNSHFLHPDDLLDPERGAKKGWPYLSGTFEAYLSYLAEAAPGLRLQTGSEEAGAVERFVWAQPHTSVTESTVTVLIDNFIDEAYCLVRFNHGSFGRVEGGSLTEVADGLYLLHAVQSTVTIDRTQEVPAA